MDTVMLLKDNCLTLHGAGGSISKLLNFGVLVV